MYHMLEPRREVYTNLSKLACKVEYFLGGGGQGEVYRATIDGKPVALKWYLPEWATAVQRMVLEKLIMKGIPDAHFLWPLELVTTNDIQGFGYIMPLREERFKSVVDVMKRRVDPSFRTLAKVGLQLSHSFLQLHSKGLCYRDISFGNVFFDPGIGDILICDNDNVGIEEETAGGIWGTHRFMAPEIVKREAYPSIQTDLYSLAVLLFYIFMLHHPLEGKQEVDIKCLDLPAMTKIYGNNPIFIFDPNNHSNEPVKGYHDNALVYWPIYPQFLRDLFTRAFTNGIRDPLNGRVRESEWRAAMACLYDSIVYCAHCGSENFYDTDKLKLDGKLADCWCCQKEVQLPFRIRIDRSVIMLNHDTQLFPHHIDPQRMYDYSQPIASVTRHPTNKAIWGLKNLSAEKWVITKADETTQDVEPGRSVSLATGLKIHFGSTQGEIRY